MSMYFQQLQITIVPCLSKLISHICSLNTQQWKLQYYKSANGLLSHYHTHCKASNSAISTMSLVHKFKHSFA